MCPLLVATSQLNAESRSLLLSATASTLTKLIFSCAKSFALYSLDSSTLVNVLNRYASVYRLVVSLLQNPCQQSHSSRREDMRFSTPSLTPCIIVISIFGAQYFKSMNILSFTSRCFCISLRESASYTHAGTLCLTSFNFPFSHASLTALAEHSSVAFLS